MKPCLKLLVHLGMALPPLMGLAQKNAITTSVGIATVRGELVNQNPLEDQMGMDYSIDFLRHLKNEKWMFTVEFSYSSQNVQKTFSSPARVLYKNYQPPSEGIFSASLHHSFVGAGLRYCFANSLNEYNPYCGQLLPYLGVSVGAMQSQVLMQGDNNFPDGYKLKSGKSYHPVCQFEAGIGYVLNKTWVLEIFGSMRPGLTDYWDGVSGTTGKNDWLVRSGLGVQYRL